MSGSLHSLIGSMKRKRQPRSKLNISLRHWSLVLTYLWQIYQQHLCKGGHSWPYHSLLWKILPPIFRGLLQRTVKHLCLNTLWGCSHWFKWIQAMCNLDNVTQLFRSSEDEQADVLWTIVKSSLMFSLPDNDSTESSFHEFWDDNIWRLLEVTIPCRTIWDSNKQTSTALLRLDFGVLIDSICAFRGEEKAPKYQGHILKMN